MSIIDLGTTRIIEICGDKVYKQCREGYKYENEKEYNNWCLYRESDIPIVNTITNYKNNIIEAEKCKTLEEYFKENDIIVNSLDHEYMDRIFLFDNKEIGDKLNYGDKRDYIITHTNLSFEEMQVPDNWGINNKGELVLIDYSR